MINAKGPNVPANKMSYTDFYIRYENKYLINIYSKETSEELKSLEPYYEVFDRFLTIAILLESAITNQETFSETSNKKLSDFIEGNRAEAEN